MHASPVDVGNWDINCITHIESGIGVVVSTLLLPERPRPASVYEIFSIRTTMSEDGTGDLVSAGISDTEVPAGASVGNTDGDMMVLRQENPQNTFAVGSVYWHWGRSNQLALSQSTIYMPPGMLWDGPMHGVMQNGGGATVVYLFTVTYRVVRFSERNFPDVVRHILPGSATKNATDTVP